MAGGRDDVLLSRPWAKMAMRIEGQHQQLEAVKGDNSSPPPPPLAPAAALAASALEKGCVALAGGRVHLHKCKVGEFYTFHMSVANANSQPSSTREASEGGEGGGDGDDGDGDGDGGSSTAGVLTPELQLHLYQVGVRAVPHVCALVHVSARVAVCLCACTAMSASAFGLTCRRATMRTGQAQGVQAAREVA